VTARIATAAQIESLYSPGGANVHPHLTRGLLGPRASLPSNGITIGSAVFAGITIVRNAKTQTTARQARYAQE